MTDNTRFSPIRTLAPYASDPAKARGRRIAQPSKSERSPFQRDKDRIIHSSAFRRLKGKTQVFVSHEGDYYRTRLTHSLEVSQIARSISRVLGLDEDLTECLALAHDLGHPPFGHSGEDALQASMEPYGGFDHNAQTLRIIETLEGRYAEFDGLNLTWETLEGIAKHNGPLLGRDEDLTLDLGIDIDPLTLPWALRNLEDWQRLELHTFAGPEAQVAAIADDIAYNNHDIDDGLRAGLFTVADIRAAVPLVDKAFADVEKRYPGLDEDRVIHEAVRDLIGYMVADVLAESRKRLAAANPQSPDDIRALDHAVIAFSDEFLTKEKPLRAFLMENMYRHYKVNRMSAQANRVVGELFENFINQPDILPTAYREQCNGPRTKVTARVICDYIASMTDGAAVAEHRKLTEVTGYL
jgi:dGTPase